MYIIIYNIPYTVAQIYASLAHVYDVYYIYDTSHTLFFEEKFLTPNPPSATTATGMLTTFFFVFSFPYTFTPLIRIEKKNEYKKRV